MSDLLPGILPLVFIFGTAALLLIARDRRRAKRLASFENQLQATQDENPLLSSENTVPEIREKRSRRRIKYEQPCRTLKFTEGLRCTRFFIPKAFIYKQRVAAFDGGPSNLYLANGKEYSYSNWMPEWVKNKILPEGSAEIGLIADHNYQRVTDEASADMKFYPFGKGEPEFYKEGELDIVAHSETPLPYKHELLIACRGTVYKVLLGTYEKLFRGKAEIYENNQRIASIRHILFWSTATFEKALSLLECIYISMLTSFFYVEKESEQDETEFRGSLSKREWRAIAPKMGFRVDPNSPLTGFWQELQRFYISPTQEKFEKLQINTVELENELRGAENNADVLTAMSFARISEKNGWKLMDESPIGKSAAEILKGGTELAQYISDDSRIDLFKLDLWWMSYFATGEKKFLDKISHYTTLPIEGDHLNEAEKQLIFKAALWSIQYNFEKHEAVKSYMLPPLDEFSPEYERSEI